MRVNFKATSLEKMTFLKLLRFSVCEIAYIFKQAVHKREALYSEKALIVSSL